MPPEIKALKKSGYTVRELTPYQFRVDGALDLYPKRQRFFNIRSKQWGNYPAKRLAEFVAEQLAPAQESEPIAAEETAPGKKRYFDFAKASPFIKLITGKKNG